jgi:hypothetical protein
VIKQGSRLNLQNAQLASRQLKASIPIVIPQIKFQTIHTTGHPSHGRTSPK